MVWHGCGSAHSHISTRQASQGRLLPSPKMSLKKFSRVITRLPFAYLLFIQLQALGPDGVFPGQSAGDSEIVLSSGGHGGYFRDTGF